MKIVDQNLQLSSQTQSYQRQELSQGQERYLGGQLVSAQRQHELQQSSQLQSHSVSNDKVSSHKVSSLHQLADKFQEKFPPPSQAQNGNAGWQQNSGLAASWNRFLAPNLQSEQVQSDAPTLPEHLLKMVEVIEGMMERMTGKPYRLQIYGYQREGENAKADAGQTQSISSQAVAEVTARSQNLQLNFRESDQPFGDDSRLIEGERIYRERHYFEAQAMQFAAKGQVTTESGQSIAFQFQSQVSREFISSEQFEMQKGLVMQDPLVVNFGGQTAQLTLDKITFDLDADGQAEQVNFLQAGSGFLVLDKNHNGQIDNGTELFGPQSGNGFADLSAYDEDQNGWIDENDAVFANLQIWHQDANGFQQLDGLLALNIGAIALQNVNSEFTYKDAENNAQAQIQRSSVFLKETSGVGSVQQIDLVV